MKTLINLIVITFLIAFTTTGICASTKLEDVTGTPRGLKIAEDGSQDVNLQDQHTPTIILPMAQELGETTLTADTVKGAYTMAVTATTGALVGRHIRIINSGADRYFFGTILDINSLVITVDTPIDFVYLAESEVTFSNINMAVDGDPTPIVFVLRTGSPSIPSDIDITRIIFTCITDSAVDLTKFGDLTVLTRGIVLRKVSSVDGETYRNIFNVKSNAGLTNIAYDFTVHAGTNPQQGVNGFVCRLTFGGPSKMGVVLRLAQYENLEILIQDDIDGLIWLSVILEGHVAID